MAGTKLPFLLSSAKNFETVLRRLGGVGRAAGEPRRIDAHRRLVRGARVARERDGALELGFVQIRPVGRRRLHDVRCSPRRPARRNSRRSSSPRRLSPRRESCPRSRPCRACSRPSALADGPNDRPTSITSGACGPLLLLVGLDRLDFVARAAVGVQLVDRDAVFRLEAVDQRAVAAPVARQRDDGELPLLPWPPLRDRRVPAARLGSGGGQQEKPLTAASNDVCLVFVIVVAPGHAPSRIPLRLAIALTSHRQMTFPCRASAAQMWVSRSLRCRALLSS